MLYFCEMCWKIDRKKNFFCILSVLIAVSVLSCKTSPKDNILNSNEQSIIPYEVAFEKKFEKGVKRAKKIEEILVNEKNCSKEKAHFAVSVVFPELTRYTRFQDFVEVKFNKYFRQSHSIGYMQMKPSFALELERLGAISFSKNEKERIKKLENLKTQCDYLLAFLEIYAKMNDIKVFDEKNIKQFATAYNVGFTKSKEELDFFSKKMSFPYRGRSLKSKWNYSIIAENYYKNF